MGLADIYKTELFQSTVNAATEAHGISVWTWVLILYNESESGTDIHWDWTLGTAFAWQDSVKGHDYYRAVYDTWQRYRQ